MPIVEPVIRPPAEADSFLLQVTVGCSANHCTFCGAYSSKPFGLMPIEDIKSDIDRGALVFPEARRVFLLDGDALVVSNSKLIPILEMLDQSFTTLSRVSGYANGYNITQRTDEELKELYDHKLRLIYIGLESGNQEILDRCHKPSSADEMIEAVRRAARFGIKSSVIVLLGLGGKRYSDIHVCDTIKALNIMQPRYLSFLSLMVIPGTELDEEVRSGEFEELNSKELLQEAHDIIKGLELEKTVFRCNHASNYLPLEGRLPKDKTVLLDAFKLALKGKRRLKPEFLRGL